MHTAAADPTKERMFVCLVSGDDDAGLTHCRCRGQAEKEPPCCDLAMLCNQAGEFELAEQLEPVARLHADHIALRLRRQQQQHVEPQRLAFSQFGWQGLSCYEQNGYAGAAKHYEQALLWAPHNSSTQLNLLHSVLQCICHNIPIVRVTPADIIRRIQLQPLVGA